MDDTSKLDYEAGEDGEGKEDTEAGKQPKDAEQKPQKEDPAADELENESGGEDINEDNADAYEERQNANPQVGTFSQPFTFYLFS